MILRQSLLFIVIGATGFLVDAGVTMILVLQGQSPVVSRVPAILLAAFATWLLNRSLVFQVRSPPRVGEGFRYATVAAVSALFNYGMYVLALMIGLHPLLAIALATGAGAAFSFIGYSRFAFRSADSR